jgi:hypothetical protein
MKHYHGQDTKEVNEREGYGQMEWDGRFTSKTPFRFWREDPVNGTIVDTYTSGQELFERLEKDRDKLESFADDLKGMKRPPSHPSDALRLADSIDRYFGLG